MYIPTNSRNLKDQVFPQIRLGLQGPAGSGKTTSALTFPNPIVLNFDRGLTQFTGMDIVEIPFWDEDFVINTLKCGPTKPQAQANRRDALLKWLKEEGLKLTSDQTLIIDSWTSVQNAFDAQQDLEPKFTKTGGLDDFDFWAKKIEFSQKVMQYICSVKSHVVVTFHEHSVRDVTTGQLLEKIAPLMQGKFVAQIKIFFTDFFRMLAEEHKSTKGEVDGCKYFWQVRSDNRFDAKTRLKNLPADTIKVEPNFNIFSAYGNLKTN